jgi:hypothetical protein
VQSTTFGRQKNFDFIVDKMNIAYSHRESYFLTRISCIFQQSNKAAIYNSRVASSRQNLNAMVKTYREGKTPIRPVWPGIRTRMRSASNYPCLRREKNPGGRTGYLENHWDSFFVGPKCGKRMSLTSFPDLSPRGLNLK